MDVHDDILALHESSNFFILFYCLTLYHRILPLVYLVRDAVIPQRAYVTVPKTHKLNLHLTKLALIQLYPGWESLNSKIGDNE